MDQVLGSRENGSFFMFKRAMFCTSVPTPKKSLDFYYNIICLPWAPAFSTIAPIMPLPSQYMLDYVTEECGP